MHDAKVACVNILVSGASSQIGHFLLPFIVDSGHQCIALSRSKHADVKGIHWVQGDLSLTLPLFWQNNEIDAWFHLAALSLSLQHIRAAAAAGVKRFVGFSSTSVFTKLDSSCQRELQLIEGLIAAETSMREACQSSGVAWTLFRPTLIYGAGMDKNITFIHSMIDKFGFFPVIGRGKGMRQPVHAADLAQACLQVLDASESYNKAYNLSGGEVLSYRQMVERVFASKGKSSRIVHLPGAVMKSGVSILRSWPKYRYLNQAMVDRMQSDMVFSHHDATRDFGYAPRSFLP